MGFSRGVVGLKGMLLLAGECLLYGGHPFNDIAPSAVKSQRL